MKDKGHQAQPGPIAFWLRALERLAGRKTKIRRLVKRLERGQIKDIFLRMARLPTSSDMAALQDHLRSLSEQIEALNAQIERLESGPKGDGTTSGEVSSR